jgi:hypothetical protein
MVSSSHEGKYMLAFHVSKENKKETKLLLIVLELDYGKLVNINF